MAASQNPPKKHFHLMTERREGETESGRERDREREREGERESKGEREGETEGEGWRIGARGIDGWSEPER